MRGRVADDGGEAVLPVVVSDPGRGGTGADVEAILDTGFTGHLTLSVGTVGALDLLGRTHQSSRIPRLAGKPRTWHPSEGSLGLIACWAAKTRVDFTNGRHWRSP